jgi:hypothetical protein
VTFAPDGIHIALSGQVVADVQVLLNTCRLGPFRSALTTDISGELAGRPFTGPDPGNLAGELVGNEDPVPAANPTFLRCPLPIAALLNAITGAASVPAILRLSGASARICRLTIARSGAQHSPPRDARDRVDLGHMVVAGLTYVRAA